MILALPTPSAVPPWATQVLGEASAPTISTPLPGKFGVGASFAFPVLKVEVRNMDKKLDGVKNERCPPPARSRLVKEKTNG